MKVTGRGRSCHITERAPDHFQHRMGAVAEQAQGDATKEGGAAVPAARGAGMHTNPNIY